MANCKFVSFSVSTEEWRYLGIRTRDGFILTEDGFEAPNEEEQKVMIRLGYTSDTLEMLRDSEQKIGETRVYVLSPDYVAKEIAKEPEHDSLWRASWLDDFLINSSFYANCRNISYHDCLRGVLASEASSVPEGH